MSRREGPPGRETAAARSRKRRIWYGYGSLIRTEKSGLGLFLHDTTRVFAEEWTVAWRERSRTRWGRNDPPSI